MNHSKVSGQCGVWDSAEEERRLELRGKRVVLCLLILDAVCMDQRGDWERKGGVE